MSLNCPCFILYVIVLLQAFLFFLAHGSSKVHIVYMGERKHEDPQLVQDSHYQILANLLGSNEAVEKSILYSYKHGFSGFAAILTKSQAELIAELPGVAGVVPNSIGHVQTTRSWDFLNVKPQVVNGILSKAHSGTGSIIGVIDTGIWPESESFNDDGMSDAPSRWHGICQGGEQFNSSHCNRKIIGARWYIKGYEAEYGKLNKSVVPEFLSPRDAYGHGTHTASTAAGVFVKNASFVTLAKGLARGGAPSAWLAVYKACWQSGQCSSADILAAFDDAIADGVDVLSLSLSTVPIISIGSFHAVAKGITVVCSAGNSGPQPQTVAGIAPWLLTVAASTIDRAFPTAVTLGNNQTVWGQSLLVEKGLEKFHPLVSGQDIAASKRAILCAPGSLNATLARGKVVLCFQSKSGTALRDAIMTVKEANAVGLILAQFPGKFASFTSVFPMVLVDYTIGLSIQRYIQTTRLPVVKIRRSKTVVGNQFSPEIAHFSSRGPNSLLPYVLKPDIAAPGVDILAAWSPVSIFNPTMDGLPPQKFKIDSGTSMSCPHVSGIVALLKSIHPTWSPAAIKSAIITTASIKDNYKQHIVAGGYPHKEADPFDYGGGHIEPNKVVDPGLIYNVKTSDYIHFLCSLGYNDTEVSLVARTIVKCHMNKESVLNLNQPFISVPELKTALTVRRNVTNVGPPVSIYKAKVQAPPGIRVKVEPSVLAFNSTAQELTFNVTFTLQFRVQGRYSFGYLYWEDGVHVVQTPLVIRSVIQDSYSET